MTSSTPIETSRALRRLLLWAAFESLLVALHALYAGSHYKNPGVYHVIVVALFWFGLAATLSHQYSKHPGAVRRWLLFLFVAVPYIGIFGIVHGAVGHGLKLIFYHAGASPEQLATHFDFGDFVVPGDALFEVTGLGTFVVALFVGYALHRLMKVTRVRRVAPRFSGSRATEAER